MVIQFYIPIKHCEKYNLYSENIFKVQTSLPSAHDPKSEQKQKNIQIYRYCVLSKNHIKSI